MALKATIFKAALQIADLERSYYADHAITIARHPSEADERMMMRLLAFALNAHDALAVGAGLGSEDEPDLWRKDLTGAIEQWIEVGLPDEKQVRRACGRAAEVRIFSYGGARSTLWWRKEGEALSALSNLAVTEIALEASQAMARLVSRSMSLQCTIQDGQVWLSNGVDTVHFEPEIRLRTQAIAGKARQARS